MSQRKEKYLRRALRQYEGIVQDVDRLKIEVAGIRREIRQGLHGLSEALTRHGEVEAEGRQAVFERMIQNAEDNVLWTVEIDERLRQLKVLRVAALIMATVVLAMAVVVLVVLAALMS